MIQISIEFYNGDDRTFRAENFYISEGVINIWDKQANEEIEFDMDDIDTLSVITVEPVVVQR